MRTGKNTKRHTAKRKPAQRRKTARKPITKNNSELAPEQLRWRCTPELLKDGRAAESSSQIIGQERALRALKVGLEMAHFGYNIFVTGVTGTGRTTTVKKLLGELEHVETTLTDKCYVFNFRDSDSPRLIVLPAGKGIAFKKDTATLLSELISQIPAAFESRRYNDLRKSTLEHFQERQRSVLRDLERKVKERGFEVVQVQSGTVTRPEIAPVLDGNPVSMDQFAGKVDSGEMTKEAFDKKLADQAELERQMDNVMREMRNIERKAKRSAEQLSNKVASPIVEELVSEIIEQYTTSAVHDFLGQLKEHVLANLSRFTTRDESQPALIGIPLAREEDRFIEFQVNVVVDNSNIQGRPIIIETNPRYKNLFGTIERVIDRNGVWRTDFMLIKPGSLLKADGGFLVINSIDALIEPGVWTTLKRVLRNSKLEIQPPDYGNYSAQSALKPEPIAIDVKVVMVGDAFTYSLLYELDDDFKKIFKIRSDFDTVMPNDAKSIDGYITFIRSKADEEKLLPFGQSGMMEIIEFGVRLAGQHDKISTRFTVIADILREASYWAGKEGAAEVTAQHVRKAIDERIERVRMLEEKIQEMIVDGSIRIDTEGAMVGQVNGLSVYEMSGYSFGKPSRLTAKTAVGRTGIINIERESDLSGPSHNKGVLILTGYIRDKYSRNKPLVLSASIAFEQSYGGVDGDSASSAEVYALLSSLSDIPIRQDLAVTGSVDQHGNIQPIGGVNQKIEGFFDVCKARGLTGTQGVLIPKHNRSDLMLRHDVVDAVRNGKFHIYSIATIDEGIEILFATPAKVVHAKVDNRLAHFAKRVKKLG
ncbi:MAG: AAA family ATPase [Ignavibacteriae bacterium]|nr:AAA family ATPase [Ignavibacteriota bacterium]